ncbi:phosphopantetheine-binding protein [Butyrivibrio sp. YAB3001]|uniref:phosphopantetheine-binding protein n=1 Tax=Butyrivibrio sp. YAB3001 TaxID=1520812 RepID=UPI0008F61890|nr:phosphopantetheine-binding protein [Butyrivibrio sp. YAB3001]SFB96851.1 acyl carrier protein [Butyrivibrio sp. YAB3001]
MSREKKFKEIVSRYCDVEPKDMKNGFRFREDLGFSSLDFMSLLGELEDEFDVELEENKVMNILTIGDALGVLDELALVG